MKKTCGQFCTCILPTLKDQGSKGVIKFKTAISFLVLFFSSFLTYHLLSTFVLFPIQLSYGNEQIGSWWLYCVCRYYTDLRQVPGSDTLILGTNANPFISSSFLTGTMLMSYECLSTNANYYFSELKLFKVKNHI